MGIAAIVAAIVVSELVTRVGTRPVQLAGATLAAVGLVLLARSRPEGAYAVQLLPGLVLFGAGVISVGVPTQVAAVSQVRRDDAGIASGVVNSAWQVGGSLGLAIASTVSASHVTHRIQAGASRASPLERLPLRSRHSGSSGPANSPAGAPRPANATHRRAGRSSHRLAR